MGGGFGHVGVVTAVNPDGTARFEEYNFGNPGAYSNTRTGRAHAYLYIGVRPPGSRGRSPKGRLDTAKGLARNRVRVRGWAFDPDNARKPIRVEAWIDGPRGKKGARKVSLGYAKLRRNDVARVFKKVKAGPFHGFDRTIGRIKPGRHVVRVYALNRFKGGKAKLIGRKAVRVPKPARPATRPRSTRLIAYDNSYGINVIRADGTEQRLIVAKPGSKTPRWSPNGRWIAYERQPTVHRYGSVSEGAIRIVKPTGSGDRFLARGHHPSWSKDGREVYFLRGSTPDYGQGVGPVMAVDIASGRQRRIGIFGGTRFSPNGEFTIGAGGAVYKRDGSLAATTRPANRFSNFANLPADWSPGNEVIYACYDGTRTPPDLCGFHPAKGTYRRFRPVKGVWEYQAAYSPDGRFLAVTAREGLYVTSMAGRGVRWLVRNPGPGASLTPFSPMWKPR